MPESEEQYRACHVLLNIDWVRNVEQCFHMADLQEGHREQGWGESHCVTLNWWYTVTSAGKGWYGVGEKRDVK